MSPEDMAKLTITIEHGWLCIRDHNQWLMWSQKLEDIPLDGFSLESIKDEFEMKVILHEQASSRE